MGSKRAVGSDTPTFFHRDSSGAKDVMSPMRWCDGYHVFHEVFVVTKNILLTEIIENDVTEFISPKRVKEGMEKSHKVINRLLNDAELLLKHGRYPASVSCTILAYEEAAKADYLRKKAQKNEGITKTEWNDLTASPGVHTRKLTSLTKRRSERIQRFQDKDGELFRILNQAFGFPSGGNIRNAKHVFSELNRVFPKLNSMKQDCFYLEWNATGDNWSYFDKRFNEKTKKAIAESLIMESRRELLGQKYLLNVPIKKFVDMTKEEFLKLKEQKATKEYGKFLHKIHNPEMAKKTRIALKAIDSYPEKKKK